MVADAFPGLISVIPLPGDSFSALIPADEGTAVRVTICRLDSGFLVVWGGVVSGIGERGEIRESGSLDPVTVLDSSFRILPSARSAFLFLGYPADDLRGLSLLSLLHPEDHHRVGSALQALSRAQGTHRVRYRIRHREGGYSWVESVFSPRFHPDGSLSHIRGSVCGVDDLVREGMALQRANTTLSLLSGYTRHDIMNQITGLIGYLEILGETVEDEDAERLITKEMDIVSRVRYLADITREYDGLGGSSPGFIDVDAVVYKVMGRAAFSGKIAVHRQVGGLFVYADRMFEQAILMLLENSLQHGGDGVVVRFSYHVHEEELILVMDDSGPGIPEHEKGKIFSRTYPGRRGYGLFLVSSILDITGIRIRETGTEGTGARFEILVPADGYRITSAGP